MTSKPRPANAPPHAPSRRGLEPRLPPAASRLSANHRALNAADGTRQLLISGAWTMLVGLTTGLLAATVFGGISRQGAHTNPGWLALMVAMMATPFALLLLLLGGAKWLRNLRIARGHAAL